MHSTKPLGEKLKFMRTSKGLSLENMANATNTTAGHLSRIERGQSEASHAILAAIRTFLEIENAPLLENELELYKERLWRWNEMLDANRMDMVEILQTELAPIKSLPYEQELNMLYAMLETRVHLKSLKFDAAKELLAPVGEMLEHAGVEVRQLYHRSMGFIALMYQDLKAGLKHYLQANDCKSNYIKSDAMILFSIGSSYAQLGKPIQGILYIERFIAEHTADKLNPVVGHAIGAVAFCYHILGDIRKAEELYKEQLHISKNISNPETIIQAMLNMSLICVATKDYDKGLEYCEQALQLLKSFEDTPHGKLLTITAHHNKAKCLLLLKERAKFQETIDKGKTLAHDQEYVAVLDALYHTSKINDSKSLEYLEDVALPFYRAGGGKYIHAALELCETLESHYLTRGRNAKKADAIARISRDIYRSMMSTEYEEA